MPVRAQHHLLISALSRITNYGQSDEHKSESGLSPCPSTRRPKKTFSNPTRPPPLLVLVLGQRRNDYQAAAMMTTTESLSDLWRRLLVVWSRPFRLVLGPPRLRRQLHLDIVYCYCYCWYFSYQSWRCGSQKPRLYWC